MRIAREIRPNETIPKWWGIAYYKWDCDVGVYYQVPLNLLVGGLRAVVRWVKFPPWRAMERLEGLGIEHIVRRAVREELRRHADYHYEKRRETFSKPL